ncbi:hypothetical protein A9P82_02075 [Arachidicoccus ginsenosidimutans]|uniref:Ig-like domain-containing protein n=1 Tax=Arachidicoccus sp. BS20 TaxID=1850526 RepID=UPI0007F06A73|nr:Ig-like domain-containing protein [Arachidicoccus sp. BS20]ANI88202.1 hypothetical protein A9P82_02075 [Arachidicoccus sp. BS20]
MKRIVFLTVIVFIFYWIIPTGCAVIVPPTGGPKDSLPPVFLGATPKDSTLNFNAKTITLNFNEYVDLGNVFNELIISPTPKSVPTVTGHLRTVTIKMKDSLEPNTTYTYNFGNAIKDVNEGNILKNFTYVFSTGDHLDEQSISGRVVLAQTGGVDSTMLAVLYSDLSDTAVLKNRPKYYARLDSQGNFVFRFLPKQKFHLFVVANSYMKNYADSTTQFAFLDSIVDTEHDTAYRHLKLYAFQAYPKAEKKTRTTRSQKQIEKEKEKEAKIPLSVTTDISQGKQSLLKNLLISYNKPLQFFDSTKILLTDTNYVPQKNYTIFADSSDTTHTKFYLKTNWKEEGFYKLIVLSEAAKDSFGLSLKKADTIAFQTKSMDDYASVELDFKDIDVSLNPVLQIFSSGKLLDSIKINESKRVLIPRYEPGKYTFRILYDKNGDMKWTPGNYKKRLQPEIVVAIKKEFEFVTGPVNQWDIYLKSNDSQKPYIPINL